VNLITGSSSIGFVQTNNFLCVPSTSPQTCGSGLTGSLNIGLPLTTRILNGAAGTSTASVNVSPQQMVSVTVVLSFASGN